MTVAVVDAYDLPTAEADLAAYRAAYSLPACTTSNGCFRKVDQNGGTSYPSYNSNWAVEIALDIEMVSAVCPRCNILLVEANSGLLSNLGQGVNTAVSMGAMAVSNSYGGSEGAGEVSADTYYNHPGVAITVSTGDCGWNCAPSGSGGNFASPEYPSTSPYVTAVGGTTLMNSGGSWSETAWGQGSTGAGSGCSLFEPKPSWQHDTGCANRTVADVSALADPAHGVATYTNGSWYVLGGTSASSPIIAATFALAGQPGASDYPVTYLYGSGSGIADVVGGNNDITWHNCPIGSYLCNALPGYDGPTGLGSPTGLSAFQQSTPPTPPTPSVFYAVTPTRILDSRDGTGGLSGVFHANVARTFTAVGQAGIPAGATAVTGWIGVQSATSAGSLYIGPDPINNPTSADLMFPWGDDRSNTVTSAVNEPDGTLSITYSAPAGATCHVVFDVTGYFTTDTSDPEASTYHSLTPTRILDSRDGTGGVYGVFHSRVSRQFTVAGQAGIPPTGATAVTGMLGIQSATTWGDLYISPNRDDNTGAYTLYFPLGDDRTNSVVVKLSTDGKLWVNFISPSPYGTAQVIFDVTGYFTNDMTGQKYVPLRSPVKLVDSRDGTGGFAGLYSRGVSHEYAAAGVGGVYPTAVGVTGMLTDLSPSQWGNVVMSPVQNDNPGLYTLHFPKSDDRDTCVFEYLSYGRFWIIFLSPDYSYATVNVRFDVTGYWLAST